MKQRKVVIQNEQGIHCRPSAVIVKVAGGYRGRITVNGANGSCDLKSIMGLLALSLEHGSELVVEVEGPDEEAWCDKLAKLLETKFDFPARAEGQSTQDLIDSIGA
jgi:phosphocarrier protein